jgi:hypothetical protein
MEQRAQHTPSLWYLGDDKVLDARAELVVQQITSRNYGVIAYTLFGASPERSANTRLVVNAPRMVELLATALDLMPQEEYNSALLGRFAWSSAMSRILMRRK